MTSRTTGIDLAADPRGTGAAVVDWATHTVESVAVGCTDAQLLSLSGTSGKVGLDCPLGWPTAFVQLITDHAAMRPVPQAETVASRRPLAYRRTDVWVAEHVPPLRPLSVSADRIGHAAFRAAGLLALLDPTLDRSGRGRVAETYPAGSLHHWGLPFRGYKGADGTDGRARREQILTALRAVVHIGADDASLCAASDHALDAVVAAIAARATQLGLATLPGPDDLAVARVEGWIALPTCDLTDLA